MKNPYIINSLASEFKVFENYEKSTNLFVKSTNLFAKHTNLFACILKFGKICKTQKNARLKDTTIVLRKFVNQKNLTVELYPDTTEDRNVEEKSGQDERKVWYLF